MFYFTSFSFPFQNISLSKTGLLTHSEVTEFSASRLVPNGKFTASLGFTALWLNLYKNPDEEVLVLEMSRNPMRWPCLYASG